MDEASTTFRSEHIFRVCAKEDSRFFTRKFSWTGSGSTLEPAPEIVTDYDIWGFPKLKIHGPMIVENQSRIVIVDLGKTLGPGQEETVHFKHQLKDLNGTFEPFLSVSSKQGPVEILKLQVSLPVSFVKSVYFDTFDVSTKSAIDVKKLECGQNCDKFNIYKMEIVSPKFENLGYKIRWEK